MPKRGFIQRFHDLPLRTKLIAAFLLVVAVPMVFVAVISNRLISSKVQEEIEKSIEYNLDAAWIQYYVRADQMKFGMLQVSETVENAILTGNKAGLRNNLLHWKSKRPYVDIWLVVDRDRKVIARMNSDESGDLFELNGIVDKAISSGSPVVSTEVVPRAILLKEGNKLADEIVIPVIPDDPADERHKLLPRAITDALVVTVVVPVMDDGGVIGAMVSGDILNRDNFVPDTLAAKIPGLLAAIAKDGVRIATTIPNSSGYRAIGTLLPTDALTQLTIEKHYRGTVTILKEPFISAYDSILDINGNTVGTLFVGIPEARFTALHSSTRFNILFVTAAGIIFAVAVAIFVSFRITKPLRMLTRKTKFIASGNMEVTIPVDASEYTKDEVSLLTRRFNEMIIELKERGREKDVYLSELEKKTTTLTELNEKLQAANQELEVALEEAQSQQEELQSANEELTILNELLEKKSNELFDANMKITEEEAELKRMRDQLSLIFNGIKDYIVLLDPECNILEVNKSFLDAYGLKENEVIGKKCYNLVYGLYKFAPECDISAGADVRTPHRQCVTTEDNKVLERYVFPVFDSTGNLIYKIEHIRDVTVETLLREQLIQAEKLTSLGEILSGVAHELNNPLTGVIGYCELLCETVTDKELKEHVAKINDSALRCKKIIENLLSFARQRRIEKQYSNINELIRQAIEMKTYQLKVDNIDVVMDLNEDLPNTMVDPYMIQQVFLNIINNAHFAMAEKRGGGRLSIKSEFLKGRIKISFTDTGVGIPETNLKKIFDPFFSTREVGKGTGLGLSVSYGIIKDHNGEIYALSSPGEGTAFIIELPVAQPKAPPSGNRGEGNPTEKGKIRTKRRILVIDDEPSLLNLFRAVVEEMGHEVDIALDARLAMEKLALREYDLILSDMRMPNMDGRELYQIIEKLRPELKERIIFTTGDIINYDTQSFLKESRKKYLEKPFTPADLKRIISDYFTA